MKIQPVEKTTKQAYQGFGSIINVIGRVIGKIQSNGWIALEWKLFITDGAERNLLGNDILQNLSIKVSQLPAPSFRQTSQTCSVNPCSAAASYKNQFETDELIKRTAKIAQQIQFTKFILIQFPNISTKICRSKYFKLNIDLIDPLKTVQVKGKESQNTYF